MKKMTTSNEGVCHKASDSKSSISELNQTKSIYIHDNLPLSPIENGRCQHFSIWLVSFVILCTFFF